MPFNLIIGLNRIAVVEETEAGFQSYGSLTHGSLGQTSAIPANGRINHPCDPERVSIPVASHYCKLKTAAAIQKIRSLAWKFRGPAAVFCRNQLLMFTKEICPGFCWQISFVFSTGDPEHLVIAASRRHADTGDHVLCTKKCAG